MTAILIKSSKIYDGTGAPPFVSDILIKDDRIESISNIEPTSDHLVIESNGLAASPGFIDTHTHSDGALLNNPQHAQSLRQGVTTERSAGRPRLTSPAGVNKSQCQCVERLY